MAPSPAEIISTLNSLCPDGVDENDFITRTAIADAAKRLLKRVQTPFDFFFPFAAEYGITHAAIQIFIDLGIWDGWTSAGGGERSLAELVKFANKEVEPELLARFLRLLTCVHFIDQTAPDRFTPTKFSLELGKESGIYHTNAANAALPQFLSKHGYNQIFDATHNPYTQVYNQPFFTRVASDPLYAESFNGFMSAYTREKCPWTEWYDTSLHLLSGADLSPGAGPVLVDIGGNIGVDIAHFLATHPSLPKGSVVLEDLPHVIPSAVVDVKTVAHDFFTPQPEETKDARGYLLHAVLHDWAYEPASKILTHLKEAMKPGYSKLLIVDIVIPEMGATIKQISIDLMLMVMLSGAERLESAWRKLLEDSGFRIIKIWVDPRRYESLIEAELA
ncbi:putative O-methyltransferase [Podospora australis]|uniref:O-methyltransferase n=1 Tax=Podospora australis TaxID=1536484 RepID=A0AAN6WSX9_9PEZI|nr:putative O-methyltransferase [Podospora australis]